MSKRRFASRWAKALLLGGALAVGFVLCEGMARVFLAMSAASLEQNENRRRKPNGSQFDTFDVIGLSANPRLIYELLPGRSGAFQGAQYRSNSYGMRGPATTVEKSEGVWRIAALGDSTMFGWRVEEAEAYPAALERALNSVGDARRYEVLNFAVPGYNTALEAELYTWRVRAFKPDLTLLQFDVNDLALANFVQEAPSLFSLRRSYLLALLRMLRAGQAAQRSFGALLEPQLEEAATRRAATNAHGLVEYYESRAAFAPKRYRYMVGWPGVKRALDRLRADSKEPILHLSCPYPITEQDVIETGEADEYTAHVRRAAAEREAAGEPQRFFYLDITTATLAFARALGVRPRVELVQDYPADMHPTPEAHALLARAIYLGLVRDALLPADSKHYAQSEAVAQALWDEALAHWRARQPAQERLSAHEAAAGSDAATSPSSSVSSRQPRP